MDDRRPALFCLHDPAESYGMAFREVAANDKDAVTILQILQEVRGSPTSKACAETRHRSAVSYTGLVLDTHHA